MDDKYFMNMALDLARKGEGFTSPNPMVGAVVVKEGMIVGKGYHQAVGGAHAEVNATDDAGNNANGATLYVTLEPCNHTGRTPPCTEKILRAGIQRVVSAMDDPNPDVTGGGLAYLKEKGIEITRGVCEDEAKKLNEVFIKYIRTKLPFVIVKCAATLDGRIATRTGDSRWVSGEASRRFVHQLRHASDAILVGIGTVNQDNPSLTARLESPGVQNLTFSPSIKGKDPIRVILDTHLSISEDATVLHHESEAETLIITGNDVPTDKKTRIVSEKVKVIESPLKEGRIDFESLIRQLGVMGITSLLIEGGSQVIASALAAKVVDKILFFYAPKILGGDDGVPICKGPGPALMRDAVPIRDISVRRFDEDVMIEGYIQ